MSTRSLLVWVALVAGVELAVRGYLSDRSGTCHGGALLFALGLAGLAWPRRARGAGLVVAGGLAALVAVDAAWAAWREAPEQPRPESPGRGGDLVARALERFECPPGVATLDASETPQRWDRQLADAPGLALVYGSAPLLDELIETTPELHAALGGAPPPRASPLIAAVERSWRRRQSERRWRRARDAPLVVDPARSSVAARYRAALLSARRAGAEVTLLVAAPGAAAPAATREARSRWLVARAHTRLVRTVAGAYGLRVIEVDPDATALGERLGRPDAGCRERQFSASERVSRRASGRIT